MAAALVLYFQSFAYSYHWQTHWKVWPLVVTASGWYCQAATRLTPTHHPGLALTRCWARRQRKNPSLDCLWSCCADGGDGGKNFVWLTLTPSVTLWAPLSLPGSSSLNGCASAPSHPPVWEQWSIHLVSISAIMAGEAIHTRSSLKSKFAPKAFLERKEIVFVRPVHQDAYIRVNFLKETGHESHRASISEQKQENTCTWACLIKLIH